MILSSESRSYPVAYEGVLRLLLTWNVIAETDRRHRYKAEVKSLEERPVFLPKEEKAGTGSQVDEEEAYCAYGVEGGAMPGCGLSGKGKKDVPDYGRSVSCLPFDFYSAHTRLSVLGTRVYSNVTFVL